MSSDLITSEIESSVINPLEPGESAAAADVDRRSPFQRHDWRPVLAGIIFAGGLYPIVLVVGSCAIALLLMFVQSWRGPVGGFGMGAAELLLIACWTAGSGFAGAVWAAIVSTVTLPLVYLVARSLRLGCGFIRLSAFSGGLVGFLATLPLAIGLVFDGFPDWGTALILFAIGPVLATIMGQIGGAWGGRNSVRDFDKQAASPLAAAAPGKLVQFSIRHLLWISVWVSLLLAAVRLVGIPFEVMLPLIAVWIVGQAATLYLGSKIANKWRSRTAARTVLPADFVGIGDPTLSSDRLQS